MRCAAGNVVRWQLAFFYASAALWKVNIYTHITVESQHWGKHWACSIYTVCAVFYSNKRTKLCAVGNVVPMPACASSRPMRSLEKCIPIYITVESQHWAKNWACCIYTVCAIFIPRKCHRAMWCGEPETVAAEMVAARLLLRQRGPLEGAYLFIGVWL